MHQYISFYELLFHNTNLGSVRNKVAFLGDIIQNYEKLTSDELQKQFQTLFNDSQANHNTSISYEKFLENLFRREIS
jgi:hypothetical protein